MWYEMTITFEAKHYKDADRVYTRITESGLICEGDGKGKKHRCKRQFIASLKPVNRKGEPQGRVKRRTKSPAITRPSFAYTPTTMNSTANSNFTFTTQ